METSFLFSFFRGLLFLIPEMAIFIACVYYFIRHKSPDSILLSLGSLVSIAVTVFYNIVLPLIQQTGSVDFIYSGYIFNIISLISFAGHVSFAVGLFILVFRHIKLRKETAGN